MENRRKKAWIGALISMAGSAIGGLVEHNQQKKAQARELANRRLQESQQQANALSSAYASQDTSAYDDKVMFKAGGRKKYNLGDRISRNKMFACGGKHKAKSGTIRRGDFHDRF